MHWYMRHSQLCQIIWDEGNIFFFYITKGPKPNKERNYCPTIRGVQTSVVKNNILSWAGQYSYNINVKPLSQVIFASVSAQTLTSMYEGQI